MHENSNDCILWAAVYRGNTILAEAGHGGNDAMEDQVTRAAQGLLATMDTPG
jgi:hypothetical protein